MYRSLILSALVALTAGCPGTPTPIGFTMRDFFPIDNGREWAFGNLDVELDYTIDGLLDPTAAETLESGVIIQPLVYTKVCNEGAEGCIDGPLYTLWMSQDSVDGVALWAYSEADGERVLFDSPLKVANAKMGLGETATSVEVDGHTFTSTFLDIEGDHQLDRDGNPLAPELGCDQGVQVEWTCAHLLVESEPAGHWLTGDYWASAGWNIVAWNRAGDDGKWRTIRADYSDSE